LFEQFQNVDIFLRTQWKSAFVSNLYSSVMVPYWLLVHYSNSWSNIKEREREREREFKGLFLCNGLLDLFVLFDKISKFVANVGTLFVSSCHEELASTFVCQKREREREREKKRGEH